MARTKVPSIRDSQQPIQRRLIIHESSPESCSKSSDSSVPPTPPANTTMTQSNNEVHNEEESVTCSKKQSESHVDEQSNSSSVPRQNTLPIEKIPRLKPILEENEHFECKIGVKSKVDDVTKLINDVLKNDPTNLKLFKESPLGHFLELKNYEHSNQVMWLLLI
ncbi:uncharacterized protein LOC133818213 isoform X1 [Humulus lupulus]|uniref:uncharacterized protein LOC133777587 isoform X1 n=1 Tax=Humulus lupulus TaxID=3486 RepID=UPI002B41103F|nr:uncharacterized protein LOC133777587 isoform X1 [Humulus lupulus]XP_062083346.1 uncharacterized protein LOC133789538 isoform X1 [Humulus lupulus]XP_062106940.1 uncharacterized protein LOC133818213 isoform X1 [Humulus lupulus]